MEYSEPELDIICDSCCSIFLLVASSDSKIHENEEDFFLYNYQKILSRLNIISDVREKAVLEFWAQDRFTHQHIVQMKSDPKSMHLQRIHTALKLIRKKENEQDFLQYRNALMNLAAVISKISRSFWGFGNPISKSEEKVLNELSIILNVPIPK